MKFNMIVKRNKDSKVWTEVYDFPVKTIRGATKHAQKMIDDYNIEERRRYGDDESTRSLVGVTFTEQEGRE